MTGDAFRRHLARIAKECKLSCNTYNKAEELTGVSKSTIIRMEVREDVRLNAVLKLLDAAGYEGERMKVLKCIGFRVEEIEIENTLEALQKAVGGYIESLTLIPGKAVMIVNEEGVLLNLTLNPAASALAGVRIVGPALIVGVCEDDFCDLDPDTAKRIITKKKST